MKIKVKKESYNIAGLLGEVSSPISRLVPILRSSEADRLFAFGDGLEGSFSQSDFDELVEAGHVVRLSKHYPFEKLAPKIDPEFVNESQLPYSLPYYALYTDFMSPEIDTLKVLLDLREYKRSAVQDEYGRQIWLLSTDTLLKRYRKMFERVERDLDELLVETQFKGSSHQYVGVRDSAAWGKASLLMELAHDYYSSERAITYGALMRMTDLGQDSKWYFWVSLACRVWAVESGREHWVERVKAKWDALRVRAHKAQLVSELFLSGQMQINYRAAYAERGIDSFQGFNKETDFKADLVAHYFKARPASPTLAGKASVTLGRISMNSGAGIERSNATTYSRK